MPNVYMQAAAWYVKPRTSEGLRMWCQLELGIEISEEEASDMVEAAYRLGGDGLGERLRVTIEEREAYHLASMWPAGWTLEQLQGYRRQRRREQDRDLKRRERQNKPPSPYKELARQRREERERLGISRSTQDRRRRRALAAVAGA